MAGGFQDIKDHPFCVGLDWSPSRIVAIRPFDVTTQDLPRPSRSLWARPTKDVKRSLFDGF